MKRQLRIWMFALTAVMIASGSSCPRFNLRPWAGEPAPVVFASPPTLDQIIQYYNSATSRVQQLQTTGATLSTAGLPISLRANIALERPRRFRLQAGLTGPEIDLGSNDEVFWLWARRSDPPAVYFCRHDQFHSSAARAILPVQPEWIAEAMGLVYFDPSLPHEGPYARGENQLEIRSIIPTPTGHLTKITVIDAVYAWVLQQQIVDANGQIVASAIASKHRHNPLVGFSLPRQIDIQLPTAQLSFTIEVSDYVINQLSANPQQLWSMPQIDGYPLVDLARPPGTPLHASSPTPSPQPPAYPNPYAPSAHAPPTQYPPTQYPPTQYPPANVPPAQYPPTQYPPANVPPPYATYSTSTYGGYPRRH